MIYFDDLTQLVIKTDVRFLLKKPFAVIIDGRALSGKTTLADILRNNYPGDFVTIIEGERALVTEHGLDLPDEDIIKVLLTITDEDQKERFEALKADGREPVVYDESYIEENNLREVADVVICTTPSK
ncbi:MAG: hypothetical protein Q4B67_01260 [Eubacteriales bacterium]|nr:hypothetical protein [Eubacteriales bacterium]